ncbi:MAG: hypothetical protein RLZZ126_1791 [Pseudomonadota bacterium]|jgi:predicted dienelactone hydrolase/uncharacterized membrane protein
MPSELTPLIAVHATAAICATVIGPWAIWARKTRVQRPRLHRAMGYAWVTLMLLTALSAVFISDPLFPRWVLGPLGFSFIHLLIPIVLFSLFGAFWFLLHGNLRGHRITMVNLYIGACLVAGFFTLAPNRLLGRALRQMLGLSLGLVVWVHSATPAWAGMGLDILPGPSGDGPVTLMYPSDAPQQPYTLGPFEVQVARQGALARHNGRLVVISHGSRSSPMVYTEFARALVDAGFVVAFPEHAGDNWRDGSKIGPTSFALRPLEVSRAIDAVAADPRFAKVLDFQRVGMWGMSAGGHTALSLAGGRWSATRLRDHCERDIGTAYNACTTGAIELRGGPMDGLRKSIALGVLRSKLTDATEHSHTDARIRAIVAGVPFAADFDFASLAQPVAPLGIVQALGDQWLLPQFNSGAVLAACASCERVADLPTGGHAALLAPLPPDLTGWTAQMLQDPPGFDRARALPPVYARTVAFFRKHLLP